MGDIPPQQQPTGDFSNLSQDPRFIPSQFSGRLPHGEIQRINALSGQSQPIGYPPPQSQSPQQPLQYERPDNFNMNALGHTLPNLSYQGYGQAQSQGYSQGVASSGLMYQVQNAPQYSGGSATFNMLYPGQYQAMYGTGNPAHHLQSGSSGYQFYNQGFIAQQQQHSSQYVVQPNHYGSQNHLFAGNTSQYGMRGSYPGENRLSGQQRTGEGAGPPAGRPDSSASNGGKSSVVRGPPRKPRQSGHAIWIGNLPPQTDLMSLVLHVCKEAQGLESLFLISKSNCAFANFKDEPACTAAQQQIHDSKFQTVRLVSRLRRSSVGTATGVAIPTGPAALTPPPPDSGPTQTLPAENDAKSTETGEHSGTVDSEEDGGDGGLPKDKFFVVKSLTVEDLDLSVRNGIWATQSHNEEALNKAYQSADNVYLVFSANKSGEYFGYAKMISPINDDPSAAIEFAPKAQAVEDPELPKAISTPATEFAPRGRIIDDSARGTIFWEAEREEGVDDEESSNKSDQDEESAPASKAWGKPFKVEWLSTNRLPFYRTRGLRNPWNSNREVKIARDGTELETAIGRRLTALFHRIPEPSAPPIVQMNGMQMPLIGYPPVRQF